MPLPQDRVVLVTGASTGIGRAVALAFTQDGARVAVLARREIKDVGALALQCDVRRSEEVRSAVEAVVAKFGALHVLVNNAGFGVYASIEEMKESDLDDIFRTNVYGPVHLVQAALPHLRKTRGQIINVSSSLARATTPYSVAYCMSKHALHSFSVGLRMELHADGIEVIEVGPGLTNTEFQKAARRVGSAVPLAADSRHGWSPEKVARAILSASRRGTREVWLTVEGRAFAFAQRAFPRLTDWGLRKWAASLKKDPPPTP
jgi:NAD(P)-dependent dehydrogenase (short-subunit alcohol dehydrogenase family)